MNSVAYTEYCHNSTSGFGGNIVYTLSFCLISTGSCFANLRDQSHETFLLVRYENRKLTVKTDVDDKKTWQSCFEVDQVNLPK